MTIRYATTYVGVRDGGVPAKLADGRVVDAKKRRILAPKQVIADQVGDQVFVGTLPLGGTMTNFSACTDTSLATTTISLGTLTNPTKYVNAKTLTATDVPTALGPAAARFVQAPLSAPEDLYVTFGVAAVPGAAVMGFATEYTISA